MIESWNPHVPEHIRLCPYAQEAARKLQNPGDYAYCSLLNGYIRREDGASISCGVCIYLQESEVSTVILSNGLAYVFTEEEVNAASQHLSACKIPKE